MPTPQDDPVPASAAGAEVSRQTCPFPDEMLPTPPPEDTPADSIAADDVDSADATSAAGKTIRDELDVPLRDIPSPASTEDAPAECDQRLSQSMSSPEPSHIQVHSSTDILGNPFARTRHLPNTTSSFLKPGARFAGTQRSEKQQYEVSVELQHVDMAESFLCGYLRIQGLTDDHPTLTTYFEGEMIGSKYSFITKHPEWGSSEKVDMQHWARFPAWRPFSNSAKRHNQSLKNFAQRENIFMRWKEYFLVPDHRVRNITGASFEGFYYICFNQVTGCITGIYFHAKSEKYQHLELRQVQDRGCMIGFEFR